MSLSTKRSSLLARIGCMLVTGLALAVTGGCDQGNEGSRCNPFLSHDECGGDTLVCSGPSTAYPLPGGCVENYCCPKDPTTSSNPYCNGNGGCDAGGPPSSGDDSGADGADGSPE